MTSLMSHNNSPYDKDQHLNVLTPGARPSHFTSRRSISGPFKGGSWNRRASQGHSFELTGKKGFGGGKERGSFEFRLGREREGTTRRRVSRIFSSSIRI